MELQSEITETIIRQKLAEMLGIEAEHILPDWVDVLKLFNIIEKQNQEIIRLQYWEQDGKEDIAYYANKATFFQKTLESITQIGPDEGARAIQLAQQALNK